MSDKIVRYDGFEDVTEPGLDGRSHRFKFTLGRIDKDKPESFRIAKNFTIDVGISGTLQSVWGMSQTETPAFAGALALKQIRASGGIPQLHKIDYTTDNAPVHPPEKMNIGAVNQYISLSEPELIEYEEDTFHVSLAAKNIAELRDQINTLFKAIKGEKLLKIESERSLIDIYYPAKTLDAFTSRVNALASLVVNINIDWLKKEMGPDKYKSGGSIYLLENYLSFCKIDKSKIELIVKPLYNINNIRQGYPTHHDTADKVIEACDYFSFKYPILNYGAAWDVIIGKYISSLKKLLEVMQDMKYGNEKGRPEMAKEDARKR